MKIVGKKLLPAYILCFIFCFMLFIYEPIMMYATNINDFWFDFHIMSGPLFKLFFIVFLGGIIGITFVYILCSKLFKKENWYYYILFIIFIIFLLTYIQGNYLVGRLPGLDGSVINWSIYTKENIITLVIFLIIVAGGVISLKKLKLEKTIQYSIYLSIAIFLMLLTSLMTTLLTNDKVLKDKNNFIPVEDGINIASSDKNFYIVLLDAVDSDVFYKEWQSDAKYKDLFNDFTFYNNALAYYPFTRDSIPLILTGKINRNEKEFSEYSSNAYNNSPLFKALGQKEYAISLYDTDVLWNGEKNIKIENSFSNEKPKIDTISFCKQEIKYILFKYLPYNLKRFSKIDTLNFDICLEKYRLNISESNKSIIDNPKLEIVSKKQFKYIHNEGGHVPFNLDKNLNYIRKGTYEQKVHGNLKYIESFLNRLKNNKVYDNSVIIFMADHGYDETGSDNLFYRMNPLFIVKGINEKHKVKFSDKAIAFNELTDAFIELLDDKQSTELFQDIDDSRERTIIWYHFTEEDHMVEYVTNGKANETDKFKKTGRVFDR